MDWRLRLMRRPACDEPGHAHELTFCCIHRYRFLKAEQTCQWLADAIDQTRTKLDFALWAYVFMPEHIHLLIWPRRPEYQIQAILKEIKEPVGRIAVKYLRKSAPHWLPRITVQRGKRRGRHFWEPGGGFDRNVTEPKILLAMIDYIHNNPIRRGLVAEAHLWKWSSAGWKEGKNSLKPDALDFGGLAQYTGDRG